MPPCRWGSPMPEATTAPMADYRVGSGTQHWLPKAVSASFKAGLPWFVMIWKCLDRHTDFAGVRFESS